MLEVDIRRRQGDFSLDVSFSAEPGSITALFGPSGAGKTSIINSIAGLARPDAGRIAVDGRTLFDSAAGIDLPPQQRQLGYIFQDSRLFPHYTVRGNLNYGRRGASEDSHALDFDRIVELLNLGPLLDRRPGKLSGGEMQRVAIGRALLAAPRLLLMDEPLASIDETRRGEIIPFLEQLRDEIGVTTVYVSHAAAEVIRLADNVVLLDRGRIAATGTVEQLMSRLDLRRLVGDNNTGAVLSTTFKEYDPAYDLASLEFNGGVLRVPGLDVPPGTPIRAQILARDLAISLSRPTDTSVLNVFAGEINELGNQDGPQVDVRIDVGTPLIARVTRKSMHDLGLAPGLKVYAMVKAVAIDRRSIGAHRAAPETRD